MVAHARYAASAGFAVATLGAVVLVGGWLLGYAPLRSPTAGLVTMKFNTALAFLLLGAATTLLALRRAPRAAWALAAVAGLLGGLSLFEDAARVELGIDEAVVEDPTPVGTPNPGLMSPIAALGFLFGAAGLLSTHPRFPWRRPEQVSAVPVAVLALAALGGYLFDAAAFYGASPRTTGMALHTALGFLALASGMAMLRPDDGWVATFRGDDLASQTARRLLPAIVAVPVATGAAAELGALRGWWDRGFALSLQTVADVAVLGGIVVWGLRRLSRSDAAREDALRRLRELNEDLERRVEARTAALAAERERFEVFSGDAPVGIFHTDARGSCDYANPRWDEIAGMEPGTAFGRGWTEAIHPDERDRVLADWARATTEGEGFHETLRLLRPDGGVRWVVARATPVQDGEDLTGYVGTLEDVTERVELERRYRDLAQTGQAILSASLEHIYVLDEGMRFVYSNPNGPRAMGLHVDDLVGRTWREVGMPPEVMEPFERRVRRVFHDGRPRTDRTLFPLPDGERWFEYALAPVKDDAGVVRRVVAVSRDITDRVRAEGEARAEAGRRLEMERLEAEATFKTDFLNRAAHELATPLTPITLQVSILERHLSGDEKARTGLERVRRNVDRLERLVSDLLAAAKMQSARWRLEPTGMDVAEAVQASAEQQRRAFEREGVHLHLALEPAGAEADAQRVGDVVDNLLSNARKFTSRGGHVWVRVRSGDDHVLVEVQDDGQGFDPEEGARLFTPFTQVHDTMQVSEPGTGLGLYIAKGIVEAHGGAIGIESEGPGRGCRAWFTLPVRAHAELAPRRPPRPAAVPGQRPLVAERGVF